MTQWRRGHGCWHWTVNLKYAEDASCTLEFTKANFYLTLFLRACFFIWWVKQGMFGCVVILRAVLDHSSQVVTTPFSPFTQVVWRPNKLCWRPERKLFLKDAPSSENGTYKVMYTVVCNCSDWINHTPLLCCRTVLDCVCDGNVFLSCCYLNG